MDKNLKELLGKLNSIDSQLNNFKDGMDDVKSKVSDNINFRDLSKTINKLTDIGKEVSDMRDTTDTDDIEDSDTIEDEPYEYYMSDTLKEIWDIVEDTPNNMTLGKKIRQLYHDSREATPNSMETTANEMKQESAEQMELFDDKDTEQLELFDDTDD